MNKLSNNANLLVRWTLATACGPFVALMFIYGSLNVTGWWTTGVPIGLVILGMLMGVGQWTVLRTQLKNAWVWIPLTAVGFFLSIPLGLFIAGGFVEGSWDIWAPITIGAVLCLAQWSVLSRQVKSSILWIPASILSWFVGMTVALRAEESFTSDYLTWAKYMPVYVACLGLMLGILVGVISGIFLIFLMRRSWASKESG